jgi:hypothetical protein
MKDSEQQVGMDRNALAKYSGSVKAVQRRLQEQLKGISNSSS